MARSVHFPSRKVLSWALAALMSAGPAGAAGLEYDEYLQRAKAARSRGDWQSVASQFAQAINHPDLPKAWAERSNLHLEYGRAVGVLCQFDESEKYLLRAKEIAQQAGGSTFDALYELGTLQVAQRKFDDAVGYFSQLVPLAERESRARTSPQLVIDAYEKFAVALAATGKPDEAQLRRNEAHKLLESNPKPASAGTVTPYGAKCPKSLP